MKSAGATAWDVASRPVGSHWGGKFGVSVECPLCHRPALRYRETRTQGVFFTEYAHRFALSLDQKNEPVCTASEICRKPSDPSPKAKKGAK